MGAGGGMWANARDELLRPGFKGGGGGKPLVAGMTVTAGGALAATFFNAAAGGDTLTALPVACGTALGKVWVTDLGTDFCATVVAGFVAGFAEVLTAGFVFTTVLSTGLLFAFGASLPDVFATDFLGCGLATGDFLTAAVLAVGLTVFLVATTALVLTALTTLTGWAVLTTAFALAFTTGLAAAFGCDLAEATGFFTGLTATFAVVFDFFVCAFTVCLLWQTAPG